MKRLDLRMEANELLKLNNTDIAYETFYFIKKIFRYFPLSFQQAKKLKLIEKNVDLIFKLPYSDRVSEEVVRKTKKELKKILQLF